MTQRKRLRIVPGALAALMICHAGNVAATAMPAVSGDCPAKIEQYIDLINHQLSQQNINAYDVESKVKANEPTCAIVPEEILEISRRSPYFVRGKAQQKYTVIEFVRRDKNVDFTIGLAVNNDAGLVDLVWAKHNRKF